MKNKPVSKREIWEIIRRDTFLKALAEKFKCQGAVVKGKEWKK